MIQSIQTFLRVTVAAAVVFALIASNGVHWHVLFDDNHLAGHAHAPALMVHAHDETPASRTRAALAENEPHNHPVASLQIVGLRPPSAPISVHALVLEFEAPIRVRGFMLEGECLQIFNDTSPPPSNDLITALPARAPPLV